MQCRKTGRQPCWSPAATKLFPGDTDKERLRRWDISHIQGDLSLLVGWEDFYISEINIAKSICMKLNINIVFKYTSTITSL